MSNACQVERENLQALVKEVGGDLSERMKAITAKYKTRFDDIEDDAPDATGLDAAISLDFEVEMKTIAVKLDLPQVTMKLQEWKFDLPQVTMKDKRIVFHVPAMRMVKRKVGEKPEVHGWTIKWKPIYMHVPEPYMRKNEIVMGIPEVKMGTTSIKLDVPEIKMQTTELKFDVPQFTLKSISAEAAEMEDRAKAESESMQSELSAARGEIMGGAREKVVDASYLMFSCLRTQIQMKRDETSAMFEPGLALMRGALTKLSDAGADDAKKAATKQLTDLIGKRDAALKKFDAAIDRLIEQEKATVASIIAGLT
ncbi:hypothetical protein [Erythrobacter crassostreae]|uniref:Uncharacterized protein n=1 Tax=Erythrobacter crassostreae TaxID=2828328 RepID=A0A9X1F377_9SPHN|nr:hypothetical protein [Erythrobacter crassostrea]MBV7258859.1 hypothetical protein [Erythrobacter crassostrea]